MKLLQNKNTLVYVASMNKAHNPNKTSVSTVVLCWNITIGLYCDVI